MNNYRWQLRDQLWEKQIDYTTMKFVDSYLENQGKKLFIHKAILDARCPTLSAKLTHRDLLSEIECNYDPVTLDSFIRFIYTGILDRTEIGLKQLADEYKLQDLATCLSFTSTQHQTMM